jgi:transposase InsO family protein
MDRKREFAELFGHEGVNRSRLCEGYGVSRTLGYRLAKRFTEGEAGLPERSRRPRGSPGVTPAAIEAAVLQLRGEHPAWGGRKIAGALKRRGLAAPAASTITAILRRHGVELGVLGGGERPFVRFEHAQPNDLWQMDFKGHVAMRAGRLHPLTVLDDHSRFAVVLAACADERTQTVKADLLEAFRRYGCPRRFTADNGAPWGNGPGDPFTPLVVWLIEHDIGLGHSSPYHPQTQGKAERFHRSMKAEALSGPPFEDLAQAGQVLARWRGVYNTERPHQALDMATPIDRYRSSPRPWRDQVEPFDYAPDDIVRRVSNSAGRIRFKGLTFRVPKAFKGKDIALRPTTLDGLYDIVFRHIPVATLDLKQPRPHNQPVTDVPEHLSPMSPV